MKKKLLVVAMLMATGSANAALNAGDIMFTAFNADEDGWALTTFVDIAANTKIWFTDNEYVSGAFNTGESYSSWNTGASVIAAGTVIRFSSVDSATLLASSVGSFKRETVSGSSNWGISQSADTIYAYLGNAATTPTTFLSAISTGAFSATEGSLAGTGLAIGVNAIQLKNASDFAEYNGVRSDFLTFEEYKPEVADYANNWTDLGDGSFATKVPNITAFTIAASVPEPEAYAMMLAGLGLLGFVARRKSA